MANASPDAAAAVAERTGAPGRRRLGRKRSPRVAMLGMRSLYGSFGGVETHIRHLAYRLAPEGMEILGLERTGYVVPPPAKEPPGLKRWSLPAPKDKHLEALVHSVQGVFAAAIWRPDVLHIHAVGPALVTPLARLLGLKVVVTHHGDDFKREKWGRFARFTIRLGETFAGQFANGVIAVSGLTAERLVKAYPRQLIEHIPNGVTTVVSDPEAWPAKVPRQYRYIVQISRLVPEKRQTDLIRAFEKIRERHPDWALVLVGSAATRTEYEAEVLAAAAKGSRIFALGHLTGADLAAAFAGADLFVLPSSHEGNPIAMLEAMAARLPILASDIPPNLEIGLPADCYFPLGDVDRLAAALEARMAQPRARVDYDEQLRAYHWDEVSRRTLEVYERVIEGRR